MSATAAAVFADERRVWRHRCQDDTVRETRYYLVSFVHGVRLWRTERRCIVCRAL